jgi:serine/threonine protein kinase
LQVGTEGYKALKVLTGVGYDPKIDVFPCGYLYSVFAFITPPFKKAEPNN